MMPTAFPEYLKDKLDQLRRDGLFKTETELASPQGSQVSASERDYINLCANNYLGLANHPELVAAAKSALARYGYGMASVRFICGTQDQHVQLERNLSEFLGVQDTILYSSCFDANTGLFETLLGPEDAIISDSLNHASIIDGIRLCKAKRHRYPNNDMAGLEQCLRDSEGARYRLIATDGVFSMDGYIANLPAICDLADKYDAMLMVDDSHAVGVLGANGRGTPEHHGVESRVDILTGTLGKALGGASGGYVSGKSEVIAWLRQRSRPYLFSNTLAPVITAGSLAALEVLRGQPSLRQTLKQNSNYFRSCMTDLGFDLLRGDHPIVPVMVRDANKAMELARGLKECGVLATAFSYPVVPSGEDRIRTQMSALHSIDDLNYCIEQFGRVGRRLGMVH